MKDNRPKMIMLLSYTLIIIVTIIVGLRSNDTSILNGENSFYIDKNSFEPSYNVRKIEESEQGLQEYKVKIKGEELSHLKGDSFVFFMNKITDNAYSIKLNDIIIGKKGI